MCDNRKTVNTAELATILDISKTTIYARMKEATTQDSDKNKRGKRKSRTDFKNIYYFQEGNSYHVHIDLLLENHKMFDFRFLNEFENKSFLDRMKTLERIKIDDLPEKLKTVEIEELFDITRAKLNTLRKNDKIEYSIITDDRYPPTSKNYKRYLYDRDSLYRYMRRNKIRLKVKNKCVFKASKQFYSPIEIVDFLKDNHNFQISVITVHRKIDQKKIPCIRIYDLKKIPILEFETLNLKDIFNF